MLSRDRGGLVPQKKYNRAWFAGAILRILPAAALICACGDRADDRGGIREIVSVAPHHDTRAYVTVRYGDGTIATESWHQSAAIRCGDETFSVGARIRDGAYGPVNLECVSTRAETPERR